MKKKIKILKLRPTQFAVGMLEVDEKIAEFRRSTKAEQKEFLEDTQVPVVISPDGELYVVDKHHFLSVCYHLGVEKARITVAKDFRKKKLSYEKFWQWMSRSRNTYPYCQFGEGPRKALYLPKDIRGLADDPYRSIAWFVRKAGAFENSEKNFAEFQWANFFRKRGLLDRHGIKGMQAALVKAVKLAQSPAARKLPGFGKLNLKQTAKVIRRAKAKGKKVEDAA
jgi:hypothetical protein